jgi:hypothetical protein
MVNTMPCVVSPPQKKKSYECHLTWQKGFCIQGKNFDMEDYPGLGGGRQFNHKEPCEKEVVDS